MVVYNGAFSKAGINVENIFGLIYIFSVSDLEAGI